MKVVTKDELIRQLEIIISCVRHNDPYQGSFEYDFLGDEESPELKQDECLVRYAFRVGNSFGQGGMRMSE